MGACSLFGSIGEGVVSHLYKEAPGWVLALVSSRTSPLWRLRVYRDKRRIPTSVLAHVAMFAPRFFRIHLPMNGGLLSPRKHWRGSCVPSLHGGPRRTSPLWRLRVYRDKRRIPTSVLAHVATCAPRLFRIRLPINGCLLSVFTRRLQNGCARS